MNYEGKCETTPGPVLSFLKASSIFHPAISETTTPCSKKLIYLHRWNPVKIRQPKIRTFFRYSSFCLICKYLATGRMFSCVRNGISWHSCDNKLNRHSHCILIHLCKIKKDFYIFMDIPKLHSCVNKKSVK